jgi:hypothetical protein
MLRGGTSLDGACRRYDELPTHPIASDEALDAAVPMRRGASGRDDRGAPARGANLVGLATALLAAMCVSACGSSTPTLNTARVERAVARSILRERGLRTTVVCPSRVPRKAGHVFTCTARLDVGSYPVTVAETNASGDVRYEDRRPLVVLDIAKVEHAIAASISRQRGLRASVTCPAEVLQQAGIVFDCAATISGEGGRRYPFVVTEVDGDGHVRYVGT